jgi:TatA/E family protein of Tat protein translocase
MFFGHLPELMIVLVLALVIFGPKRLPEFGASLGKGIREFRHATSELQESLTVAPPQIYDLPEPARVPARVTAAENAPRPADGVLTASQQD